MLGQPPGTLLSSAVPSALCTALCAVPVMCPGLRAGGQDQNQGFPNLAEVALGTHTEEAVRRVRWAACLGLPNALGLHFLFGKVSFLAHSMNACLPNEVFALQVWVFVNRIGTCDLWDIRALICSIADVICPSEGSHLDTGLGGRWLSATGRWAPLRLSPGLGAVGPTWSGDRVASCPYRAGGRSPGPHTQDMCLGAGFLSAPPGFCRLLVGEQEMSGEHAGLSVDRIKDQTKGLEWSTQ